MNKYLEKIAELDKEAYVKGFQVNRLGIRRFGDVLGWNKQQKIDYLKALRHESGPRGKMAKGYNRQATIEPGFFDSYATAYENRHLGWKQEFEDQVRSGKIFPKTDLP